MITTYTQLLNASIVLFLDHRLLSHGQAYTNISGRVYPTEDPNFANKNIWASQSRQWVYDSSVIGANVPTGTNLINKGTSGLYIDYNKGRIITNSNVSQNSNFSLAYSVKDFSIYPSNLDIGTILFENQYRADNEFNNPTDVLLYNEETIPGIFIRNVSSKSEPHSFGGQDKTINTFNLTCVTNKEWKLDSLLSLLQDSQTCTFPLLNAAAIPFNAYGDFKSGVTFSYNSLLESTSYNKVVIDTVNCSKLSYDATRNVQTKNLQTKMAAAAIEIVTCCYRHPRILPGFEN